MRKATPMLARLARTGYGQRLSNALGPVQRNDIFGDEVEANRREVNNRGRFNQLKVLATYLLALNSAVPMSPSGSGHHLVNSPAFATSRAAALDVKTHTVHRGQVNRHGLRKAEGSDPMMSVTGSGDLLESVVVSDDEDRSQEVTEDDSIGVDEGGEPTSSASVTGSGDGLAVSTEEDDSDEDADSVKKHMNVDDFLKAHNIILKREDADRYKPIFAFDETPFLPEIKQIFRDEDYVDPTPIQSLAWPIALEGRDMVSIAKTGSGKTIAYLMPAFHKYMLDAKKANISEHPAAAEEDFPGMEEPQEEEDMNQTVAYLQIRRNLNAVFAGMGGRNFKKLRKKTGCSSIELVNETANANRPSTVIFRGPAASVKAAKDSMQFAAQNKAEGPKILVLCPTRELTSQIAEEAEKYSKIVGLRVMRIVGAGARIEQQIFLLRTIRPELVVATPGRARDLVERGELKLSRVEYLVLDEADRMLDLGFENELRQLIKKLPAKGQALMFSATWPEKVRFLSSQFLEDPVLAFIGDGDTANANKAIKQHVKIVNQSAKEEKLFELLDEMNPNRETDPNSIPKTIIFVAKKRACESLYEQMGRKGYKVDRLHSRMQQHTRTKVMGRFRRGELRALVTTDVASRGLDVRDIETVINYDMPDGKQSSESYVHRIGRTARGDNKGAAYTFFTKNDKKAAKGLIGVLKRAGQEVPEDLQAMTKRRTPYKNLQRYRDGE